MKVHIIGGTGAMGNWLKGFLETHGVSVTVSGRGGVDEGILKSSDIIIFSVPISFASNIIEETSEKLEKNTVLIDLSSSQMEVSNALKKTKLPSAAVHFLFGPTIISLKNQKMVLNVIKSHRLIDDLIKLFEIEGAHIIKMDAAMHDEYMAHIQNLTHFANIAIAKTYLLHKLKLDGKVSTPNSLNQLAVISSIVSQPPSLISEIQLGNDKGRRVIKDFIKYQQKLISLIKKNKKEELVTEINEIHQSIDATPKVKILRQEIPEETEIKLEGTIGYLGPAGTFSNQVALKVAKSNQLIPCTSIFEIFEKVANDQANLGVVPAENTTEGTIRETLDYLIDFDLKTNGSINLPIHQNLLSDEKNVKDITTVYSHPQGIAQCRNWLHQNLPQAKIITANSTVSAIGEKRNEKGSAFISSELAAKLNNISILEKNIEDKKENITRFYIISKKLDQTAPINKTLLFLTVFNRVGILRDILDVFASNDINLSKIESRPSREKIWDYHFFIEVEVSKNDERLIQSLNILKQYCPVIKTIGGV